MYAVARLYGYSEEAGFKAWVGRDLATALGLRVGDGIRVETKSGASSARIAEVRDDVKAGVVLSIDVYMAVAGFRTVLLKKLSRAFEAHAVSLGVAQPIDVEQLAELVNVLIAYRVPVFTNFMGYVQGAGGRWIRISIKEVSPREPAYLSRETKIHVR
ncbi:molybdopterin-binding protein [Pyrobaculum neutrophilum]|uniref:Molybdopterin-binding protein n=1 Tax=Pyrobaculum neutrophilum (strain DSM 2338 / JCM 9278 / NBRC 100436 / V24Sta) TaxID=444157 RepID=B1YAU1_PYRNV|nr:molybdopterin-binding protein [Pyrobaculum neutrophilum]ACB39170.1 conserved hypothetical protein [Pyrobaculum neutrophilum V24Sta]